MPLQFDRQERTTAEKLIDWALAEDLDQTGDLTCRALIPPGDLAEVHVVAREEGILAGSPVAELLFQKLDPQVRWTEHCTDGSLVQPGTIVATAAGPLRSLLSGERSALNFLNHLSGIASLTRRFVDAVTGTKAQILDTRKTIPGWRTLAKYAVRAGGGTNHRMGLYDGILIKDNHLAAWAASAPNAGIAQAVQQARETAGPEITVEVEVDTLEQLADALTGRPDIVLLDNMDNAQLRRAVELRNQSVPAVLLEASGGITVDNVSEIAQTGVDRISIGALTHSAPALDLAFDWKAKLK